VQVISGVYALQYEHEQAAELSRPAIYNIPSLSEEANNKLNQTLNGGRIADKSFNETIECVFVFLSSIMHRLRLRLDSW